MSLPISDFNKRRDYKIKILKPFTLKQDFISILYFSNAMFRSM